MLLDVPLVSSGFVGKYPTKEGKLQTAGFQCKFNAETKIKDRSSIRYEARR